MGKINKNTKKCSKILPKHTHAKLNWEIAIYVIIQGVISRDAAGMENFGRARSGDISREFPSFFGIPEFRARFSTAILDHTRPIFPKISRKNGGYWLSIDAGIDRVLMRVCSGIGLGYWLSIEADNNASQFQKNCVIILHLCHLCQNSRLWF